MVLSVRGFSPSIPKSCYIAETATVIGDVVLGEKCSLWFNVVLRGDVEPIRIGDETNIQDGTVVHGTYGRCGVTLGRRVTIGHNVLLHGCQIGDGTLIGMGAIVMDKARVGKHCLVGAGSLVTENADFPDGHLILGRPAKVVRKLTESEIALLEKSADNYLLYKTWYPVLFRATPHP